MLHFKLESAIRGQIMIKKMLTQPTYIKKCKQAKKTQKGATKNERGGLT